MFDIHGDTITFDGIDFATINGKCWPTLRSEAEAAVVGGDGWLSEEEAEKQASESYDEGQAAGVLEGEEATRTQMESEFEEREEDIRKVAFAEGRADGVEWCGRTDEAAKSAALLIALDRLEGMLRAPLNGIKGPDDIRARPIKLAELKEQVRLAIGHLSRATAEYRS